MKQLFSLFTLLLCSVTWADTKFPTPLAWEANLEKVKVQDVIPEFSPGSDLSGQVEAKYKSVLEAKGLIAKKGEGHFAILTPFAHCSPPYSSTPNATQPPASLCQVGLYLRERAPPPILTEETAGKRLYMGIVSTYSARFTSTLPPEKEVLNQAFDALLANFVATVERQKNPPPRK